jgi:hypothetical protein
MSRCAVSFVGRVRLPKWGACGLLSGPRARTLVERIRPTESS